MSAYYNEIEEHAVAWLRALIGAGQIADGEVDTRSIADVSALDLRGFRQCHFFAGIGGWPYALRLAGWPDDQAAWTGSCPCQPWSVAGAKAGGADSRDLWPAWFQLIAQCRPRTVFGEQVEAALGHGWFDRLADDLEREGYAVGPVSLPATCVGAPHQRQRLWFVADAEWDEQSRQEPCGRPDRRVGREQQLFPWHGGWAPALARFRVVDDGLPRCVAGTDAARNAIVPQVAAEVIGAYMELLEAREER